jgi:hypothetical protein
MAAPQQQQPAAAAGPINNDDVANWTARLNDVLARPGEYVNSKSPATAQPWYNSFFGCFAPIDTCLMSWCCPCVVFGRTHHRMRKGANLEGYEPINTSVSWPLAILCSRQWNFQLTTTLPVPPLLRLVLRRPSLGAHGHAARRHAHQAQPRGQLPL